MVRFRELYGDMPGILVPGVLLDYSGKRVITSEWVDGEKVKIPLMWPRGRRSARRVRGDLLFFPFVACTRVQTLWSGNHRRSEWKKEYVG